MSHTALLNDETAADEAAPACESDLLDALASIQSLAAEHGDAVTAQASAELRSKLCSGELNLVVVGQFKRGKTSVLNALIGAPILPVAVIPLTSVVTVLRYGEFPRGMVFFRNGSSKSIDLDSLAEFVTERGNPRNGKGVSRVEVFYPSGYLRGGVRLIDTPGIGSVYEHNTRATCDFVPKIDAAIFVTSTDPPLTPAEVDLLSDVAARVEKVFLIVNKTDLLDDSQLSEVLDFTAQNLPGALAGARIFPVSARLALEARRAGNAGLSQRSGFPQLETEISRFLREDKEEVFRRAVRRRLLALISDLRIRLTLEIEAARLPVDELKQRLAALNVELDAAARQEADSQILLQGHLARLTGEVAAAASDFASAQEKPVQALMEERFREIRKMKRRQMAARLDAELRREIESRMDAWLLTCEKWATGRLREQASRFARDVNDLIRQVRNTAGSLFGVELNGLDAEVELVMVRGEGYHTDPLITWGLGSLPLLLPGSLYERYLRKHVRRQAPLELERNATRRSYDLRRRLEQSAAMFRESLKKTLDEAIGRIRGAIHSAMLLQAAGEETAGKAVARRRSAIQQLDELERGMGAAQ